MKEFIDWVITQLQMFPVWQLIIFSFISACIQQIFPPYPSDVLLLFFGGLTAANIIVGPAAIIPYVIGTIFSSLILFYFSRHVGSPILNNKYIKKFFPRYAQRKARVYMRHYGTPALAFCKFLPGINTVCIIVAGVIGMRGAGAVATISVVGLVQNIIYFVAGMIIGDNIPNIYNFSKEFSVLSGVICGVLVLAAVVFIVFRIKNRRKSRVVRP